MTTNYVVTASAVRTPIGSFNGIIKDVLAEGLLLAEVADGCAIEGYHCGDRAATNDIRACHIFFTTIAQ
ncbi:hypothetical protein PAT3040_02280 [Paenibacillus agaridevorans]|uniref:Uncharacterized protein n=1 Tax=Paenibacillus agaridevorans TaxID=171404 RepID=A0A2R5EM28_9BACL|nr:hypothetical protein PAT3040_02280 [Paenibacillus agaridevorans]